MFRWIKSLLSRLRPPTVDDAIEDLKQNYADAVYNLDYDVSRDKEGNIVLTPRITRIK